MNRLILILCCLSMASCSCSDDRTITLEPDPKSPVTSCAPGFLPCNSPPSAVDVRIEPAAPKRTDRLTAVYSWTDPDGDPLDRATLEWFRNGALVAASANQTLVPGPLTPGDTWHFVVTACDATGCGQSVASAPVTVQAPVYGRRSAYAVHLFPPVLAAIWGGYGVGFATTYEGGEAPDPGSELELSAYVEVRHYHNGVEVPELRDRTLEHTVAMVRGDTWRLEVTPCDLRGCFPAGASPLYTVADTRAKVGDLKLLPERPTTADKVAGSYAYTDADGDAEAGSRIQWFKDGVEQPGLEGQRSLPFRTARAGERWSFAVTPCNAFGCERTSHSEPVIIGNGPPSIDVIGVEPAAPQPGEALAARYRLFDPDGDAESGSSIRWFRDGVEQTSLAGVFSVPAGQIGAGEVWAFEVTPCTALGCGAAQASPVAVVGTAQDALPRAFASRIEPTAPRSDQALLASYGFFQRDGELESGSTVTWLREGVQAATGRQLPPGQARRGERWSFRVEPCSASGCGPAVQSGEVVIENGPPVVSTVGFEDGWVTPQAGAGPVAAYEYADPDGDPEGATRLRWLRNGAEVSELRDVRTVPGELAFASDKWQLVVTPCDSLGSCGEPVASRVYNTWDPSSSVTASEVRIIPAAPAAGAELTVDYRYFAADDQLEVGSRFVWKKNGVIQDVVTNLRAVPGELVHTGDSWEVAVTPCVERLGCGETVPSPSVSVL